MPFCKPGFFSVGRSWGMCLINIIWHSWGNVTLWLCSVLCQRWWDVIPAVILYYLWLCLAYSLPLSFHFWLLISKLSQNLWSQEIILTTIWENFIVNSSPVKPPGENSTLGDTLNAASWVPEQTQLSFANTYKPQKLWDNKCVLTSKFIVIC